MVPTLFPTPRGPVRGRIPHDMAEPTVPHPCTVCPRPLVQGLSLRPHGPLFSRLSPFLAKPLLACLHMSDCARVHQPFLSTRRGVACSMPSRAYPAPDADGLLRCRSLRLAP